MASHSSTHFEIKEYYQNEWYSFNGIHSRNNLSEVNDGTQIINFDECESIGAHWIALYVNDENITYFES